MKASAGESLVPPLRYGWSSAQSLGSAAVSGAYLAGVGTDGKMILLNTEDGSARWESTNSYISTRLASQGTRLFAYRLNEGFGYVDYSDSSVTETLALSFGATQSAQLSSPIPDGDLVYLAVNQGLYCIHQREGLQFGALLDSMVPHTPALLGPKQLAVISGIGVPSLYAVGSKSFDLVWQGEAHGLSVGQKSRPFVFSGNLLVLAVADTLLAYDLSNGRISWKTTGVPATTLGVSGERIIAGSFGGELWAIDASSGHLLWTRKYLFDSSQQLEHGLAVAGDVIYFGGALRVNPDHAFLLAVRANDGSLAWLSRSAGGGWAGGIPITAASQVFCFSSAMTGMYSALSRTPAIDQGEISVSPRPLTGPSSGFGSGMFAMNLTVHARIHARVYREKQGLGEEVVQAVDWSQGLHEVNWTVGGVGGFDDVNQFGFILVDVEEPGGGAYTHAVLMPVNTFPDIQRHWGQAYIEAMIYFGYVNGYPDQTFRPDNLVTRAESCTIIAKTLGLRNPSPGFQSKFTDLTGHWAKPYVTALEERGVVGGFQEPDGTYTFRPDLNMTRAQKARILVQAYQIPAAPNGFRSKFTDISGHWAEPDVKALEAAGFVSGYQESDGSFTYRPDRNLSRAELCALIVRIRGLQR